MIYLTTFSDLQKDIWRSASRRFKINYGRVKTQLHHCGGVNCGRVSYLIIVYGISLSWGSKCLPLTSIDCQRSLTDGIDATQIGEFLVKIMSQIMPFSFNRRRPFSSLRPYSNGQTHKKLKPSNRDYSLEY